MPYKDTCHTITFDNGREFAEHEKMATELKADIYFANPYHSWERHDKGVPLSAVRIDGVVSRLSLYSEKSIGWISPTTSAG